LFLRIFPLLFWPWKGGTEYLYPPAVLEESQEHEVGSQHKKKNKPYPQIEGTLLLKLLQLK
jgi:hypothetical protein